MINSNILRYPHTYYLLSLNRCRMSMMSNMFFINQHSINPYIHSLKLAVRPWTFIFQPSFLCAASHLFQGGQHGRHTVDGSEIRQTHQLRLVVHPIISTSQVGKLAGFLNHQQYYFRRFQPHLKIIKMGSSSPIFGVKTNI